MATFNVSVKGEGVINNAAVYLEDPLELIPLYLNPLSPTEWERNDISAPLEGPLDYSLIVIAFTGTKFSCTITNADDGTCIKISGKTGVKNKNYYHEKGSRALQ
jgi:hypothetical protein